MEGGGPQAQQAQAQNRRGGLAAHSAARLALGLSLGVPSPEIKPFCSRYMPSGKLLPEGMYWPPRCDVSSVESDSSSSGSSSHSEDEDGAASEVNGDASSGTSSEGKGSATAGGGPKRGNVGSSPAAAAVAAEEEAKATKEDKKREEEPIIVVENIDLDAEPMLGIRSPVSVQSIGEESASSSSRDAASGDEGEIDKEVEEENAVEGDDAEALTKMAKLAKAKKKRTEGR